jgi:hypothetical protein
MLHDNDIIEIGATKLRFFERKPKKSKAKKMNDAQPVTQTPAD